MTSVPKLDLRLRKGAVSVAPRVVARTSRDPLTGHRGESGEAVVVQIGPATLVARLTTGTGGPVLRGQLTAREPGRLLGALVHARGDESAALAAADGLGEFALKGWQGRLLSLELELEEGAWSVPWPSGDS